MDPGVAPTAVFGIDYADTRDFVAAGILWKVGEIWCWKAHSWICTQSATLPRIQFPYLEAVSRGEATLVDEPQIPADYPADWIEAQMLENNIRFGAIDHFRIALMRKTFKERGWDPDPKKGNIKLTYRPEVSEVAPIITSAFISHKIRWGDSMTMRWYTNNACRKIDSNGNITFEKIEPKTRNTAMMVHNAAWGVYGNSKELRKSADDLDIINGAMLQSYIVKAGDKLPAEKLEELTDGETWLSAEMCIQYGLADEYAEQDADLTAAAKQYQGARAAFQSRDISTLPAAMAAAISAVAGPQEPPKPQTPKASEAGCLNNILAAMIK